MVAEAQRRGTNLTNRAKRAARDSSGARESKTHRERTGRRAIFSPLTRRVLAVNILALAILVGGLLYLDEYQSSLIDAEIQALRTQGEIIAGALGEGAVQTDEVGNQRLSRVKARQMVRRLVDPVRTRARLFGATGDIVADSRTLVGPGGAVQVEELPPPQQEGYLSSLMLDVYDAIISWLPWRETLEPYRESSNQRAEQYREVMKALVGEADSAVRAAPDSGLVLTVAIPVQRYKQIAGALLMSFGGEDIEQSVRAVRLDILKVFGVALAVTILLSLYLAGTITRPIRRLAAAAEQVRHAHGRQHSIPDFSGRQDEVGELAGALREMTDALWKRMDAIERFAADVAHEIKNPLSSLRSAVETATRVQDAEQQRRLMAIIQDDVQRLDRLITDISDASRLDAELSRAETTAVDIGRLLSTLKEVHPQTAGQDIPRLRIEGTDQQDLEVAGIEGRLGQVLRNLISNAISFSPSDGLISLKMWDDAWFVNVSVEDQGPGIPDGKLEAIFDRFYSERPVQEKFGLHSGLGLSISRQIVEAHGGSIRAENCYDGGTRTGARFILRLPKA